MSDALEERIIRYLQPILGKTLCAVTYRALHYEIADISELAASSVYIGGEVVLDFNLPEKLIIGWDENAGWNDHFSVQACTTSTFLPGSLQEWSVSQTPLWNSLVGSELISWRILGGNDKTFFTSVTHTPDGWISEEGYSTGITPHIIELIFPQGGVLIGDGYQGTFGDGDDIIIRASGSFTKYESWQEIASAVSA